MDNTNGKGLVFRSFILMFTSMIGTVLIIKTIDVVQSLLPLSRTNHKLETNNSFSEIPLQHVQIPSPAILSKFTNQHNFSVSWMNETLTALHIETSKKVRYQWEMAYIAHVISIYKLCTQGKHGMVWTIEKEILVSYFASKGCQITVFDMNTKNNFEKDAIKTNEYNARKYQLWHKTLLDQKTFNKRVTYRTADIKYIPLDRIGQPMFDFIWSMYIIEHAGSITLGIHFIIDAMTMVKPGGIAIHMIQFTRSSLNDTLQQSPTVHWQEDDILRLRQDLLLLGYIVFPIDWKAGEFVMDKEVKSDDHNNLLLNPLVMTGFCIIIKKPLSFKY